MGNVPTYNGHKRTEWPSDGENCRYCGAWSDDDWEKPCAATDEERAAADALYTEDEWW